MADEAVIGVLNRVLVAYGLMTWEKIEAIAREEREQFYDIKHRREELEEELVTRILPDADHKEVRHVREPDETSDKRERDAHADRVQAKDSQEAARVREEEKADGRKPTTTAKDVKKAREGKPLTKAAVSTEDKAVAKAQEEKAAKENTWKV